ncbi:MAG: squalene synthase HpnC [Burkholderiaceae bacterium]|nr:squalene synthase HpnC [Burkholderiaceae bacterium]
MPAVSTPPSSTPQPLTHYENFPVASVLCPPRLRPAVAAVYWFARTADDIADEGDAPAPYRLAELKQFRDDLAAAAQDREPSPRWPQVFAPLRAAIRQFALPETLLADLLSAFAQDIEKSRDGAGYDDRAALLDYCSRSANPVGRLLLHLYGVTDAESLARSDCICSALQLINFWQDLSQDIPRGRFYLPREDCAAHGVSQADLLALNQTPAATTLIAAEVRWARELMLQGAPLVHRLPGRAGWELRLVVQGGLRILQRIEAGGFASLRLRHKLRKRDAPAVLWHALWM